MIENEWSNFPTFAVFDSQNFPRKQVPQDGDIIHWIPLEQGRKSTLGLGEGMLRLQFHGMKGWHGAMDYELLSSWKITQSNTTKGTILFFLFISKRIFKKVKGWKYKRTCQTALTVCVASNCKKPGLFPFWMSLS